MSKSGSVVTLSRLEETILEVRGHRVMLDEDLAKLYGVSKKRLNEQVRRNLDRFPEEFSFVLTNQEVAALKSQIASSKPQGRGGRRKPPRVFTEHGAVMAATVLNSPVAVKASIEVVRAFVRMRQWLASNAELARRLAMLERKYDGQFKVVFEAIRELMTPPPGRRNRIGF